MKIIRQPSEGEFIALLAMLFAGVALAIDSMLPALPAIAAELTPNAPNNAQLVVTSFVFGMGIGTLISGPMSDAWGRKPVMIASAVIYAVGALLCFVAPSLETLLAARVLMGIGGAGPRAVGMALVRDLYKGREMAKIVSFVMMVFTLVPAIAPLIGQGILWFAGWRDIFLAFVVFALVVNTWMVLRQPETLAVSARRPLHLSVLWSALKELVRHRIALISTAAQTLTSACLFASLSSFQGIYDQHFHKGPWFPLIFTGIALCAMSGSFLNARIVVRLGMRPVLRRTYLAQVISTAVMLALVASGALPMAAELPVFFVWSVGIFAMMGLTMGNLNALAMEELGHIAGFAASLITATSTVVSVLLAVPVGLAFNGTPVPLLTGVLIFATLALGLILMVKARKA